MIAKPANDLTLAFNKLDAIREVPTLPAIALRAVEISNNEATSARELAKFIAQDQSLTATLLTMVNAAAFGVGGNIATVDRAVIVLGFDNVRAMMLLSAASNFFSGGSDCLDRTKLWRHSIGTATAARLLAKETGGIDPGDAYIAGLLHEVGIVILDRYFHDVLRAAVQQATAQESTIDRALRDLVGFDQFRVGGYLAKRWHLPGILTSSISLHNSPPKASGNSLIVAVVHVASMIADACSMNYEPFALKKPVSANAVKLLGITPTKVRETADELEAHRAEIDSFAELCSRQVEAAAT